MASAFQSNAFQNNAFQIEIVQVSQPRVVGGFGGHRKRWWEELHDEYRQRWAEEYAEEKASRSKKAVRARAQVKEELEEAFVSGLLTFETAPKVIEAAAKIEFLPKLEDVLRTSAQLRKMLRDEIDDEDDVMMLLLH